MPIISPTAISPHRAGINWSSYWATRTPSGLTVEALTDTSVEVNWVNTGAEDYTGHSIERSTDGINYSEVDTVAVGTNTYTDTVTADTYYFYRVRAYKGTNYSEYTDVAELDYGPELVGNVDMASDTWWTKGTNVTIADGVAHFSSAAYNQGLSRSAVLTNGLTYRFEFTILNYVQGVICLTSLGGGDRINRVANGTYTQIAAAGSRGLYLVSNSNSPVAIADVDNVSVRKKLTAPS